MVKEAPAVSSSPSGRSHDLFSVFDPFLFFGACVNYARIGWRRLALIW